MKSSTNIALVGCGIWGRKILRDLLTLGAWVTVFERDAAARAAVVAAGGVLGDGAYPVSDGGFDGIIVATPSTTHRAVLEAVLPLGVPVFVEKPMTTNLADALALPAAAKALVFLMHVWRYHPGILLLGELARTQVLGKVLGLRSTRANWTSPRRDTDSVWNLVPHDLTIAKTILGRIPEARAATVESHHGIARGMTALLGHDPYLTFEVSNRYERKIREVRLHCERGVAILEDEKVDYITVLHGDADCPPEEVRREQIPFHGPSPLTTELTEFLEYLAGGPAPRCSFADGLEVVRTLDALERLAPPAKP